MSAEPALVPEEQLAGSTGMPPPQETGVPASERQPDSSEPAQQLQPPLTPLSEASDEDGLALLPKHTVVRIIGNNRTKQAYIGQRAVVRRAVGLGGWHWLILGNGEEIKLQRNALLILQHPTGNEPDFSDEEEDEQELAPSSRAAAPSPYPDVRALREQGFDLVEGHIVGLAEEVDTGRRTSARSSSIPRINLNKLDMAALRRYRNRYRLPDPGPHTTKDQLVVSVAEHLHAQIVDERTVLASFLTAVKRRRAA